VELEIHHIDGNLSNNSLDNLIVLCANHHIKAQMGEISESVLRISKTRLSSGQFLKWKNLVDTEFMPEGNTVRHVHRILARQLRSEIQLHASTYEYRQILAKYRSRYLNILEQLVKVGKLREGQVVFEWVDALVAFPDSQGLYPTQVKSPALTPRAYPVLIQRALVNVTGDGFFVHGGERFELKNLPLCDGFISSWDFKLGYPTKVGKRPSRRFYGAYYWVVPYGLRAMVRGVWFGTPYEAAYGTALCWAPDKSSPLVGFRPGLKRTRLRNLSEADTI